MAFKAAKRRFHHLKPRSDDFTRAERRREGAVVRGDEQGRRSGAQHVHEPPLLGLVERGRRFVQEGEKEGCRVERDAPWGTPARSSTTLKTDFAVFRRIPLIEPYVQFSRIWLSVWDP